MIHKGVFAVELHALKNAQLIIVARRLRKSQVKFAKGFVISLKIEEQIGS